MDLETRVKLAVYNYFAETGWCPAVDEISRRVGADPADVRAAYQQLNSQKLLVLEEDGSTIRMAPPFSAVPTQHLAVVDGIRYYANCAWDVLGIPAVLQKAGTIISRCEQSGEPFYLNIGLDQPESSDWIFHCLLPATQWWDDIVFT